MKQLFLTFIYLPRNYLKALRKAKGKKLWLGVFFLALTTFNLIEMASSKPADAFLLTDLTLVGRTAGDGIMQFAFAMAGDLYGGKFGVLSYISHTCLMLATPLVAIGVVQYMSDDMKGSPTSQPVILGGIFYVILLTGGGFVFGQIYIGLIHIFEGIILKMDGYLKIYDHIKEAKAYTSTNGIISASVAECQKFVGQEQQRCIYQATNAALQKLGDFQEEHPLATWLKDDISQLTEIGKNIISPDKNIVEKVMNVWYAFNAPVMEVESAIKMTEQITAFTAIYATVILFVGLGGPIAGLSSLFVPGLQNGWVLWVTGIFGLWYWRFSFLMMCWILSEMLTKAPSSATVGTGWFSHSIADLAPMLSGAIAFAGAAGTWAGITSAVGGGALGEDAQSMLQKSAMPAMPASAGGGGGSSAPAVPSGSAPQVRTDY